MAADRETPAELSSEPIAAKRRCRLWGEWVALFVLVPLAMAAFFGRYPLFPVLLAFATLALALLAVTPGFRPSELLRWPRPAPWPLILGFTLYAAGLIGALVLALVPDRMLALPRERPVLWILVLVLYPVFSALPQELIFRALFFHRYGALFRTRQTALWASALAFGLAHLFYQNGVAVGLSTLAGLVIGWVYLRHGSVLLAVLLHAVGGQLVFTLGLGVYFFHGAIGHAP